ncbi:hypothetical protein G6F22_017628 [Rhizopus arrhizus]|nr:hypothetical protein G6F22_017628 [Rhizopus arrhizus]
MRGAALFQIDPAPLQAAYDSEAANLARAQASLSAAADKLRRYADLVSDRAISERDHAESVADERQARAQVALARANLQSAKLRLERAGRRRPGHAADGGAADRPHLRELRAARCRGDAVAEADPRGRAARRGAGPGAGAPGAAGWVRVRARRHAVVRRPGRGPRHGQRDDASAVR